MDACTYVRTLPLSSFVATIVVHAQVVSFYTVVERDINLIVLLCNPFTRGGPGLYTKCHRLIIPFSSNCVWPQRVYMFWQECIRALSAGYLVAIGPLRR